MLQTPTTEEEHPEPSIVGASRVERFLPKHLWGWRESLLDTACVATSVVLFTAGAWLFLLGVADAFFPTAHTSLFVAVVVFGMHRLRYGSPRTRSLILLGFLFSMSVMLLLEIAWGPGYVGLVVLNVVLAGLLLGRRWANGLILATAASIATCGFLVKKGVLVVDQSRMDPSVLENWIRAGFILFLGASILAYILRFARQTIEEVYTSTGDALAQTRREIEEADALRQVRIATESKLQAVQKVQTVSLLADGLAHHTNNLLTIVRDFTDALRHASSTKEVRQIGMAIESAVVKGAGLLRNLMAFSRRKGESATYFDVGPAIEGMRDTLCSALRDDIELEMSVSNAARVFASPDALQQALLGLLLNAADALPHGGSVHLVVATVDLTELPAHGLTKIDPGSYVAISVVDSGLGMPDDVLAQAVEPFFTTKAVERHPGLGLTTALSIARSAGGTLGLESTVGRGTTATIFLPIQGSSESGPDPTPAAHLRRSSMRPQPQWAQPSEAPKEPTKPSRASDAPVQNITPAATVDADDGDEPIEQWRANYVVSSLRTVAVLYGAALATSLIFIHGTTPGSLSHPLLATLGLIAGVAGWSRRLPYKLLVLVLILSVAAVGFVLVLRFSYLGSGPVGLVLVTVGICAVFGSGRTVAVALVAIVVLVFVGGLLHSNGVLQVPLQTYSFAHPENWFRYALLLGLLLLLMASFALRVLDRMREGIGRMTGAIVELHKVRSQREAEGERLLRLKQVAGIGEREEIAGRLAGSVAHDLNNALQTMTAWAWELECSEPDTALIAKVAQRLDAATDYASALVQQFDLHHVPRSSEAASVDLCGPVEHVAALLQQRLPKNIAVELELMPGCFVGLDARDVGRLLFNLAQNSAHAMPNGGTLRIGLRSDGENVELRVEDDGEGMDEETRARAFEPFFTTKGEHQGTGLGLVAVSSVVEQTGGMMELQSSPRVGTRVAIRWPLCTPPKEEPSPVSTPTPHTRGTLLVAEDHREVRNVFCKALRRAGFHVIEACDGDEAERLLSERDDIDAVCLDGVMPGLPTAELISLFKERAPNRPVVLCSGHLPEMIYPMMAHSDITFVPKPVGGRELASIISNLLVEHSQHRVRRVGREELQETP